MIFLTFLLALTSAAPLALASPLSCAQIYARLSDSQIASRLSFLPTGLRNNLQILYSEAEGSRTFYPHFSQSGFSPFLKNVVDALNEERRKLVNEAVELRGAGTPEASARSAAISGQIDSITEVLMPLREQLGLGIIQSSASVSAQETGALILLRHVQPAAAGQLIHLGVGKGLAFKFHSAEEGVIAGLVPYEQRLSQKVASKGPEEIAKMQGFVEEAISRGEIEKVAFRLGNFVAVEREEKVFFVDETLEHVNPMEIVQVLVVRDDQDKLRQVVSDVDPLAFGFRTTPSPASVSSEYGVISPEEKFVLKEFNRNANQLLAKRSRRKFMVHGPESRNPTSSGITGYPISVYFPTGEIRVIYRGPAENPDRYLKEFYEEARSQGFHLEENPAWGW